MASLPSTAVLASVNSNVEENMTITIEATAPPNDATFGRHKSRTLHKKKSSNDLRDEFYQASIESHKASQLLHSKEGSEWASST
ncbi:hypothetical protein BT96DRAFT_920068 [Gymnopus androsaceus JB14]|uniref:Uncharacterized protein n=1 Tax=Gymnopus androsaceus JB14 TaxID=1447944 RepID=A0A6A4HNE8_9AGAR|nr:hypothetical protein BT96DRAFT_920068 [Gymnopus androsaceus JB14]